VREIARRVARAPSTISRELRRNAATRSGGFAYRATTAQWHADRAARRPKSAKLAINPQLRQYVQERLAGVIMASGAMVPRPVADVEGAPARAAAAAAVGSCVESRTDCSAPPARLP
jgi:hypothetical protein